MTSVEEIRYAFAGEYRTDMHTSRSLRGNKSTHQTVQYGPIPAYSPDQSIKCCLLGASDCTLTAKMPKRPASKRPP